MLPNDDYDWSKSILSLNDRKFLIVQANYLNQFEVIKGVDYELKLNCIINLSFWTILKYINGTLLLIKHKEELSLDEEDNFYYEISG